MNYYPFPDTKTWKIFFGLFLFVMLYITRTTMTASDLIGTNEAQFLQLGLMCLLGLAFLAVNRKKLGSVLADQRGIAVLAASIVMLLPMIVKRDWQLMYLSVLLGIFFALFLTYFYSYRDVARYYVLILAALAVYSLFAAYVLKPLVDAGVLSVVRLNYADWIDYYPFGLAYAVDLEDYWRNYGIFREPGLYQFYLLVALYLNNYAVAWTKPYGSWIINGILMITMLTTQSTVGMIAMALFLVALFIERRLYKDRKMRILAATCIGILVIIVVIICLKGGAAYETLVYIFSKIVIPTRSSTHRYEAIGADLRYFLNNPLFGAGFAEVLFAVKDNTASPLILYAVYGIAGGSLHVLAWIALVWEKKRRLWINCAHVLVFMMSISTQCFITEPFFWIFPVMALVERGLPLLKLDRMRKKR